MKLKWYLQTWFIVLLCALWILIVPPIVGLILLFVQQKYLNEARRILQEKENIQNKINELQKDYELKTAELEHNYNNKSNAIESEYDQKVNLKQEQLNKVQAELNQLRAELKSLESESFIKHYNFSDYEGISSEECKDQLTLLKHDEQEFIKSGKAVKTYSSGSKKEVNNNIKQILRCFNTECDNILVNLSVKNIDSSRNKISKSFDSLNKIFDVDGIKLEKKLLEMKLEQLNLVYTYELKSEQEREQQKAIKEQMLEEEKVRREIEKEKKKLEKDQAQCSGEIKKLMSYVQKTDNDTEKQLYIDKIKELESKLKELESAKENVLEREANALAGFVYVISNIGSFGEDVYKIGMTRRLEPMDRVKELSSASVPFEFDVHAMIFSDNAPQLESTLHTHFKNYSVNKVNPRKEFFKVSIDEIEKVVKEEYNNTVEFTKIPVAKEYRQSLEIQKSN